MNDRGNVLILGVSMVLGFAALGYLIGSALIDFKEYERTVAVKGLSEREVPADIVIWPIQFTAVNNDLSALYTSLDESTGKIKRFLEESNFEAAEVTVAPFTRGSPTDTFSPVSISRTLSKLTFFPSSTSSLCT